MIDYYDKLIGANLNTLRKTRGVTLKELGEIVGVSYQQAQKYTSGQDRLSAGKLMAYAINLEVPINYFFEDQQSDPIITKSLLFAGARAFKDLGCEKKQAGMVALMKIFKTIH